MRVLAKLPVKLRYTSTPVVVLRTVASPLSHAGIGIARSLGRLGVPVFWVDPDPAAPAARSRYVRGRFQLSLDRAHPNRAVDRLLGIGCELPRSAILIPTDDWGCLLVAEAADALRERFVFPEQSSELVRTLSDKHAMNMLCGELGIPAPASLYPKSREEVLALLEHSSFPVVVKPVASWSLDRGLASVVMAQTPEEVLRAYDEASSSSEPHLLLQEFIPGSPESVWMFNGYFDERSECRVGFSGHKIRQYPPYTGPTTLGVCLVNETVERQTKQLMKAVGYRGILDIGYRYDSRDSTYKLLDVNPRVGSTFRLFVADNGMDVVRALYCDLTGQEFESVPAPDGRRWLVENLDPISSAVYFRNGEITARGWLRSFRGVAETAWWATDDPSPFRQMSGRFLARGIQRLRKSEPSARERQERVDELFTGSTDFWSEIYEGSDIDAAILQERRRRALSWIEELRLPPHAQVLEVGCGAGATAVALANRGYDVHATDTVPEMLDLTRKHAAERHAEVRVDFADAHALPFGEGVFDLVLALGVIPWLHSPDQALREFARVSKREAYVIVSADNRRRLANLLNPQTVPVLTTARAVWRRLRAREPLSTLPVNMHSPGAFDSLLKEVGLNRIAAVTVGFGPFLSPGRRLSDRVDLPVHRALQRLADRGLPLVRRRGNHYLVLARRHG